MATSPTKIGAVVSTFLALTAIPASAQRQPAPPGFDQAQAVFNDKLTIPNRVLLQVSLIAAGYLNGVPTEQFSLRMSRGLQRLQQEHGLPATGGLDLQTIEKVFEVGAPMLRMWSFQKVAHPTRGVPIWIPTGMGVQRQVVPNGLSFSDPQKRLSLVFTTFPNMHIGGAFQSTLDHVFREGGRVNYKVMKDGWFVVSLTMPSGLDGYIRYHQDGPNATGFMLYWNNANGNISGERIAILMSASLGSQFTDIPFIDPPTMGQPQVASRPANPAPAPTYTPPAPGPAPAPNPVPSPSPLKVSSGTGFFVTATGEFVTNEHVISSCSDIRVRTSDGKSVQATVAAKDVTNDLALLRMDVKPPKHATVRGSARLGENVSVFGFPHSDMLATTGNFTTGIITATSGMRDDSRFYQTSAPVQSGNSGGPMLDSYGNVVGVVTAKLNALKVAMQVGDLPQNVNFAVKTSLLTTFLEANGVKTTNGAAEGAKLDTPDLADVAKAISGFVVCR